MDHRNQELPESPPINACEMEGHPSFRSDESDEAALVHGKGDELGPRDASGGQRKVNLLILASHLWIGGAEVVIAHLARNVDRRRFNVTVGHLKARGSIGDELAREGLDVVSVSPAQASRVDYLSFIKLRRLLRERRIDIVHTHTTHGLVDAALCKFLSPRLKLVHTFHFGNYPHTRWRIKWMEYFFARVATRLFAVGKVQRDQLQALYGFRDKAIGTMWNGVTAPSDVSAAAFSKRVGGENRLIVGTIATLIEQKGLRDLLVVARRIRDSGHDVLFVIAGDGPLRAELEALRRELQLENTVVMTGWIENAANVALPAFDIFFQPSLWEAMSVVLLEAMAAAKPIVATRVGEAPIVVADGEDGLLVNPGDIDGMTNALSMLIDDAAMRDRLRRAARRKWEQYFTVEHMARAYEQVYLDEVDRD